MRPCIDYRGLNAITTRNKYSLPLLDAAVTPLHQACIFTMQNAYNLVHIHQGDEWKAVFNTPMGHFE